MPFLLPILADIPFILEGALGTAGGLATNRWVGGACEQWCGISKNSKWNWSATNAATTNAHASQSQSAFTATRIGGKSGFQPRKRDFRGGWS